MRAGGQHPRLHRPRRHRGPVLTSFPPDVERALAGSKRIYLTTWSASGKAGTVPVWFMVKDGRLYFTTIRTSLKARRIRRAGRVRVAVGSRAGPAFDGRAEWVDDRPDLEGEILHVYRRKYPLAVPLLMGRRIRRGLAAKTSVLIRITPGAPG